MIKKTIGENPKKFYCSAAALLTGLAAYILYLAQGVIPGFTDSYSTGLLIFGLIGIITNAYFAVKRMDTLEMIPFVSYIICIFLFIAVNANYLVAVVRKIDITRVSGSFIATAILFAAAALLYLLGFVFVKDKK